MFWSRDCDRSVLAAAAQPLGSGRPGLDLNSLPGLVTVLITGDGAEHLLLSDGPHHLRLDLVRGTLLDGPVALSFLIEEAFASRQLRVLQQLLALRRHGGFRSWRHSPEAPAARWIRQLRVHDALAAGASQRQIAIALFSREMVEEQWREGSGPLRSAVQRLVRQARANVEGYRKFLRSGPSQAARTIS